MVREAPLSAEGTIQMYHGVSIRVKSRQNGMFFPVLVLICAVNPHSYVLTAFLLSYIFQSAW